MPAGRKTRHGHPRPAARASDAHEPDPPPQKHAAADEAGRTPGGHDRPGNDTHTPPARATTCTHCTERRTSAYGRALAARTTRTPGRP